MTTSALPGLAVPSPSSGSWGWLGVVARWLRTASPSPGEQALVEAVERAAKLIGSSVVDATDAADLDERLDAAVESPSLYRFNAEVTRLLTFDALARAAHGGEPSEALVEAIGLGPARVIASARDLEVATAAALAQALALAGAEPLEQAAGTFEKQGARYFYDSNVPTPIARAHFEALRGGACSLSIALAVMRHRRLEPWLAQRLAESYRAGLYASLRLLASVPQISVSTRLVPEAERLAIEEIWAAHRAARADMEAMVDRAIAEGGTLTLSDDQDDA